MDTTDTNNLARLMPWSKTIPEECRVPNKHTQNPHLDTGGDFVTLTLPMRQLSIKQLIIIKVQICLPFGSKITMIGL